MDSFQHCSTNDIWTQAAVLKPFVSELMSVPQLSKIKILHFLSSNVAVAGNGR